MASHDDSYVHGEMDYSGQAATYNGFMVWATWGTVLISLSLFFFVLVFSAHQPWMGALFCVAVLGVLAGLLLKLGNGYQAAVVSLAVFGAVAGGIITLVGAFI